MLRGLFIFGAGVRPGPGPDLVTVLAKEKQEITHGGRWRSRRDDGPTPRRGKLSVVPILHLHFPSEYLSLYILTHFLKQTLPIHREARKHRVMSVHQRSTSCFFPTWPKELASMRSMDGAKFGGVWRLASAATNMWRAHSLLCGVSLLAPLCPRGNSSEVKFGAACVASVLGASVHVKHTPLDF